jgi:hypothetical protein
MADSGGLLFQVLQWAKTNGEVRAVERIRLKVLNGSIREGIVLARVSPNTTCSPEYLDLVRTAASEVVGKRCPV